jgi:uncharacterized membrane protein HdeD (DUF308 family)
MKTRTILRCCCWVPALWAGALALVLGAYALWYGLNEALTVFGARESTASGTAAVTVVLSTIAGVLIVVKRLIDEWEVDR